MSIKQKAFGVDHINTANTINNLGNTYDSKSKYDEAIAQYERALRIYEACLPLHHHTAQTAFNAALTTSKRFDRSSHYRDLQLTLHYLRKSIFTTDREDTIVDRFQRIETITRITLELTVNSEELLHLVVDLIRLSIN